MSQGYSHIDIEKKWCKKWDELLAAGKSNWLFDESNPDKLYLLDMFPYPSGSGLHVGHVEEKVALDIYARYKRFMQKNVLMPTGYDAFGLPAENYAIKTGTAPALSTDANTKNFHEQTKAIGISYDWTRELKTSDPGYYKFTQWWFKFLYERGLAYRKKQSVNWCPKDQTVLANEQVIDGKCERCDTVVVQKELEQWFFRITDYAQRLLDDLDKLDWPESTKLGQINWIGRSEGIEIDYNVPVFPQKVLLASLNPGKVQRVKNIVAHYNLGYEILTPSDLGLEEIDVEEGDDIRENSLKKVQAYAENVDLPVLAVDSGIFISGMENSADYEPARVRRNALNGESEEKFSKEEIAGKMMDYYMRLAEESGGERAAYFQDTFCLLVPGAEPRFAIGKRNILITTKKAKAINVIFPLNNITVAPQVNPDKFVTEFDLEEEMLYVKDTARALRELLCKTVTVFTTRPDTNYGATFVVLAPDSEFVKQNLELFPQKAEVEKYIVKSLQKTELERISEGKKKTGEFTGLYAVNGLNGKRLPIYISDFVLANVGTGAVVGVPGHDMRDFQFAQAMGIEVVRVVVAPDGDDSEITKPEQIQEDAGTMVNSDFLDGMDIMAAKEKIMDYLEEKGWGRRVVNFKLRDWLVSRQRYWGAPIPMLYKKLSDAEQERNNRYQREPVLVVNAHAYMDNPNGSYHEWLDAALRERNVKSTTPGLVGDDYPQLETWVATLRSQLQNGVAIGDAEYDNVVLTGRSLGSWAALKLAEEQKFRKLILVCPVSPASLAKDKAELAAGTTELSAENVKMFTEFIGDGKGNVNFMKIAENVGEIVIFLSTDDPYIPAAETQKFFEEQLPFVRVVTVRESGHFTTDKGYDVFPNLLAEVLAPVRLDILPTLDSELPVELPTDVDYQPQGTSPLGTSKTFNESIPVEKYAEVLTTDAKDLDFTREIDTMDTFVCSSWYFFRFMDPHNSEAMAAPEKLAKFGPVDFYIGGAEHTVLHLLYARFFTKVLFDSGMIDYDEPFMKLRHQGIILGPDNRKMSKRWGNVINPTEVIEEHGADTLRMYEMFMGPLDQMKAWKEGGVKGVSRFVNKVWDVHQKLEETGFITADKNKSVVVKKAVNALITQLTFEIENLKFNTGVSAFMKFINLLVENDYQISEGDWRKFLIVMNPFAPFITSELWERLGVAGVSEAKDLIDYQMWPSVEEVISEGIELVEIVVMVNGKLRGKLEVPKGTQKSTVIESALRDENVAKYVTAETIKKDIFVEDKLINFVV